MSQTSTGNIAAFSDCKPIDLVAFRFGNGQRLDPNPARDIHAIKYGIKDDRALMILGGQHQHTAFLLGAKESDALIHIGAWFENRVRLRQ